jgi:ribose 5-phosphate isomerase B
MSVDINKPIAIGADHAGFEYKQRMVEYLEKKGYSVLDMGVHQNTSVDYPDFAHPVADAVENGKAVTGILFCGSANGVAITANKHQGIRAAICWQTDIAKLARLHNNANIICVPARFVAFENACDMVDIFLDTPFEGGRHQKRVDKIACM